MNNFRMNRAVLAAASSVFLCVSGVASSLEGLFFIPIFLIKCFLLSPSF